MSLAELKRKVDEAIEVAIERGESPDKIPVTLEIEMGSGLQRMARNLESNGGQMTLNLKCPHCGHAETVHDERNVWIQCPKCHALSERQKPTLWLNPQNTLLHVEYGSASMIFDRSEALSLAERLPSLVGQMREIA